MIGAPVWQIRPIRYPTFRSVRSQTCDLFVEQIVAPPDAPPDGKKGDNECRYCQPCLYALRARIARGIVIRHIRESSTGQEPVTLKTLAAPRGADR
jgi:hypothetical protein